jgi:1-acyl-sn-glycerol-3-phosphate acyltransferase
MAFLTYPFDRNGKIIHLYARLWGKVALIANRVKVRVVGLYHINRDRPYIFMSNHQSSYDIFALLGCLPFQFKWLAKKELFSIPFFGWTMASAGYISIDREGTRETVVAMNEAAKKIRDGMSVIIFPEGSRSLNGSLQPFKKGGFSLAIKSKVPIIPVTIKGSREIMPRHSLRVRPGKIEIKIGEPIETKDLTLKDRPFLMEKVRGAIQKNLDPPNDRETKEV